MKRRTKNYLERQKALKNMLRFKDIKSFLMAGYKASRSFVVKKDIINMLLELEQPRLAYANAS